jgi:mannosyl-3-phosphoglycerate phosphatase family protein
VTTDVGARPPDGLLFTDLDGTLLDHDTYRPSPEALRIVERLAQHRVVTVPVSSKTAPEIAHVTRSTGLAAVAVAEGGSVLVLPDATHVVGVPRDELVACLAHLRGVGWAVAGMTEMSVDEVSRRTGLDSDSAARAMDRRASEPFVFLEGATAPSLAEIARVVAPLGVSVTRGGRFWHLAGIGADKAAGVDAVCRHFGVGDRARVGAVGDAWNDLSMLSAAGVGVLLGRRVPTDEVPAGILRVDAQGPAGFVRAVEAIGARLGWTRGVPDGE